MCSSHPEKEVDRLGELEHYAKFIKTVLQEFLFLTLFLSFYHSLFPSLRISLSKS